MTFGKKINEDSQNKARKSNIVFKNRSIKLDQLR